MRRRAVRLPACLLARSRARARARSLSLARPSSLILPSPSLRPSLSPSRSLFSVSFYTGTPVFKFGEGLSYTTFDSSLSLQLADGHNATSVRAVVEDEAAIRETLTHISATKVADAIATVTNSGERSGDHIAMLFAAPPAGVAGVNARMGIVLFEPTIS